MDIRFFWRDQEEVWCLYLLLLSIRMFFSNDIPLMSFISEIRVA